MVSIPCLFIIHVLEPFQILGEFGLSTMSDAHTFFDLGEFFLIPVGLGSFRVNLLKIFPEFLLFTVSILSLQFVIEFTLDLFDSLFLHFLPE